MQDILNTEGDVMDKHLFLNGGGPPFTRGLARRFVSTMTAATEPVAVLFEEGEDWPDYMAACMQPLADAGIAEFCYLPLKSTEVNTAIECLRACGGIVIGGGDTDLYADLIVDTPIAEVIRQRYESGIPVAGFSAGALISPERCVISAKDNESRQFKHRKGLNLIPDLLLSVHFTQWDEEEHLRTAVRTLGELPNYGIDEETGIYLLNGQPEEIEGGGVYSLVNGILTKIH
ncbi:Type 1 glutamine amidotransferase-like domain-containing protein [Paenibacillus sp. FSL P4-0338]|nr:MULTISPECIES: Type 1 glutamine amidotransferase-like domain-containing protein [unclassified Paenibacillus]ETT53446.1 peptidase S51 dipeptidase E [Paenibacillus sp. FSL R7-269]